PDESKLFQRITSKKRPMPPRDEAPRPSDAEIALLKQWIESGAHDGDFDPEKTKKSFMDEGEILQVIHDDLQKLEQRFRRFARYFTITHLYNAGVSEDDLQIYRQGLSKLINSLSWGPDIEVPRPIDSAKTVFRIDLRHYDWNP